MYHNSSEGVQCSGTGSVISTADLVARGRVHRKGRIGSTSAIVHQTSENLDQAQ